MSIYRNLKYNGIALSKHLNREWSVVWVYDNHIYSICKQFQSLQIPYFIPLRKTVVFKEGKRSTIFKPLIPGYFFASLSNKEKNEIIEDHSIRKIFNTYNEKSLLEEMIVLKVLSTEVDLNWNTTIDINDPSKLKKGDHVEINSGPLMGLKGYFVRAINSSKVVIQLGSEYGFGIFGNTPGEIEVNIKNITIFSGVLNRTIIDNVPKEYTLSYDELLELYNTEKEKRFEKLILPDEVIIEKIDAKIISFSKRFLNILCNNTDLITTIPKDAFSILIAEMYSEMGADVFFEINPKTFQKDLFAVSRTTFGDFMTLISPINQHPFNVIEQTILSHVLMYKRDLTSANNSAIITPLDLSPEAISFQKNYAKEIIIQDKAEIKNLFVNYGRYYFDPVNRIWKIKDFE
ncbi:transcription termination/antitermination NusG family protein [Haliscomenobacter sp.]|uniref:transcription termination/antitermination NusG family protein n=1 Tax=Haliscomenobacter sp. TaxID=2717303 RepID=UPI003BABBF53